MLHESLHLRTFAGGAGVPHLRDFLTCQPTGGRSRNNYSPGTNSKRNGASFPWGPSICTKRMISSSRSAALIQPKPEVWFVYNWSAPGREAYLRTLAEESGVTLRLSGCISEEELVEAYHMASVTACSSIMELLGLAALESMSWVHRWWPCAKRATGKPLSTAIPVSWSIAISRILPGRSREFLTTRN